MKLSKKEQDRIRGHVKCNCGHYSKEHFGGYGWCKACGCTWYWPNDRYIIKYKERKKLDKISKNN
jgi:hypothetical protein